MTTLEGILPASGGAPGDVFGCSVTIDEDRAVVGARKHDANGPDSGAAYPFHYNGTTWVGGDKLLASDGQEGDRFGNWVAISGDGLVVGAVQEDEYGENAGAAYTYHYDGGIWSEKRKLLAPDGASEDRFGWAVAISGNTAIVGAYQSDADGLNAGSAYAFQYALIDDCNGNGIPDLCDLLFGAENVNGNNIPDECECLSDIDGDWDVDTADLLALLGDWGCTGEPGECIGDVNWDGVTNTADLLQLLGAWGNCP